MLSTSFPRNPWFFLQVGTIIGITSNLSSNSKEPSKYPKVFMTDPSNWLGSNLLIRKVGFPMCSQKFLGISITSLPVSICISKSKLLTLTFIIRCPWCNDYRHRKWTRWYEFKSWTRPIAFHIALIPLGKVWIQLFSLQLWVNSRTDWFLQPWLGN